MTKKSIVPEARQALNQFKEEVANELGIVKSEGFNADITSRQAGSLGGKLGGEMTRRLVENATINMMSKKS